MTTIDRGSRTELSEHCSIMGCRQPATARVGNQYKEFLCEYHLDEYLADQDTEAALQAARDRDRHELDR